MGGVANRRPFSQDLPKSSLLRYRTYLFFSSASEASVAPKFSSAAAIFPESHD